MKLNILLVLCLIGFCMLSAQGPLTKAAFFVEQKRFPKDYKAIIADTRWQYMGLYKGNSKKLIQPDSLTIKKIELFDDGTYYRKIRRHKIITNSDLDGATIVYVSDTLLILENKNRKTVYRELYKVAGVKLRAAN